MIYASTGISLPFLSYGGSLDFANYIIVGNHYVSLITQL